MYNEPHSWEDERRRAEQRKKDILDVIEIFAWILMFVVVVSTLFV